MAISQERKQQIMKEYGKAEGDTGSPEVQIAVLTAEIETITQHLKEHPKDHSGRRGLLAMVSRRRGLLDYVKARRPQTYLDLIAKLGIRK